MEKLTRQFSVSASTIQWANDLTSDVLEAGTKLTIPPIDGVLYTVASGDTVKSIADAYKADADSIIAFNDLELGGLTKNKKIIIPNGDLPADQRPGYVPAAPQLPAYSNPVPYDYSGGFGSGSTWHIKVGTPMLPGNDYAFGNCTAYVYDRRAEMGRPIRPSWGNAVQWDWSARQAGFAVSQTPSAGAIIQNSGGYAGFGHVAIVEQVKPDGSLVISEMNASVSGGGFNIVSGRTMGAAEARSGMYQYIH
jgi:surface antigen/LysM repeat protein